MVKKETKKSKKRKSRKTESLTDKELEAYGYPEEEIQIEVIIDNPRAILIKTSNKLWFLERSIFDGKSLMIPVENRIQKDNK